MIRRTLLGAFLFLLTGQTSPPPSDLAPNDFCARLAKSNGIDLPATTEGRTVWNANALNFGQRVLFGGSAATGVGARPVEPATVEDYRRSEDMCLVKDKGAECKLVGPINFNFRWKGNMTLTEMAPGERATVSVVGTKVRCQTEAP